MISKHHAYLLLIVITIHFFSCRKKDERKDVPAHVNNPIKESQLTTITLTDEARTRLGIVTFDASYLEVGRSYKLGGEITAVSGKSASVTSPVKGIILVPESGKAPLIGDHVKKGQVLYRILILPVESDLVTIQEEIRLREVGLETSKKNLERTEQLLQDKAASVKQVELAKADYALALKLLRDAGIKYGLMKGGNPNELAHKNSTMIIRSPIDGIVQSVYAAAEQSINAGAPVIDIASISPVWVRVSVYTGDLTGINKTRKAVVQSLSGTGMEERELAKPVSASIISTPGNATTDIYYELANTKGTFRPGQRVNIMLPQMEIDSSLIVPNSAIIYDLNGGQWVYTNPSPLEFIRQRVEVDHFADTLAVIARGLQPGEKVVTAGAAELYGTEFGGGK